MTMSALAEILAEEERLRKTLNQYEAQPHIDLSMFYQKHGPRLAAVARAGMKMRGNGFLRHDERCRIWEIGAPECTCGLLAAIAAWDAAARPGGPR